MSRPALAPAERYALLVEQFLHQPGVTGPASATQPASGFGATALKMNNKIFAMLVNDVFVVNLPRQRVTELIASGQGKHFDPVHGRLMKEWLALGPDCEEDWLPLAREALEFVTSRN